MSNLINIIMQPPEIGYVSSRDTHGGKDFIIEISHEVMAAIDWIRDYRAQLQKESEARANNPALASCYHEYQTMLKLIS